MNNVLTIKNLCFAYSKKPVLNDINLDVCENDILVLLGPNGSGKTTFLKCILGLLNYNKGSIRYYGNEITDYSIAQLAKIVCFVPQLAAITNNFLVRDYIAFANTPYLKFYESPKREVYEKIDSLVIDFNATHLLNRHMQELSGGEQQLVSIIKALVQDSPIIVLDEPTSALDFGKQGEFLEYIKRLKGLGKTVIISSHNPNHALILESKVCVIQNGNITFKGSADEIITEQNLKAVYNGEFYIMHGSNKKKSCTWNV